MSPIDLKLLGVVLLIGGGSAVGFYKAYALKRRTADIIQLQNAFRLLETEIYYTRAPVPAALAVLQPRLPTMTQRFFACVHSGTEQQHLPLYRAWERALAELEAGSFLCGEELGAVRSFGLSLGVGDVQEQQKNFQLLQQRLQHALNGAEQVRTRQSRIWQYMGVCVSMAAVLLLC